ncbi:MAG: nicotinate (nicotinamide) nucleotide adenylyltransferase [bacterium]|nr:nicotinate (nicotinamide) nucleotide adenylyltransferase [bacterium]
MKVCLFSGTFNPIHIGHLLVINLAIEKFSIDLIYIIPNKIPVHKKKDFILPPKIRLKLIQLSIKELKYKDKIRVSDFEIKNKDKSYSFYTVKYFRELYKDSELYFLIGDDSLIFYKWYNFKQIFALVDKFIIIDRYYKYDSKQDFFNKIIKIYNSDINKELNWDLYDLINKNEFINKIEILGLPKIEISSTYIIDRLRKGLSVDYMLNKDAKRIIEKKYFTQFISS